MLMSHDVSKCSYEVRGVHFSCKSAMDFLHNELIPKVMKDLDNCPADGEMDGFSARLPFFTDVVGGEIDKHTKQNRAGLLCVDDSHLVESFELLPRRLKTPMDVDEYGREQYEFEFWYAQVWTFEVPADAKQYNIVTEMRDTWNGRYSSVAGVFGRASSAWECVKRITKADDDDGGDVKWMFKDLPLLPLLPVHPLYLWRADIDSDAEDGELPQYLRNAVHRWELCIALVFEPNNAAPAEPLPAPTPAAAKKSRKRVLRTKMSFDGSDVVIPL